ncbi:Fc receptor-like protein 5 [Pelobates fuscus]|uniref:Fc receptor-like protein 5 n=1 Tax=Pelobates fuscus TaxID=191477 RepID=UPI002FE4A753
MAMSIPDLNLIGEAEDKTLGRKTHGQTTEDCCSKGLALHHKGAFGAHGQLDISLTPNWSSIFQGESITMTCNGASITQEYVWYRDGMFLRSGVGVNQYSIMSANAGHSCNYWCQTMNTISDPVRLDVKTDYLILQVPHSVYEGDSVSLRCHSYPGYSARGTIFYKDNEVIQTTGEETLSLKNININVAGQYSCKKEIYSYLYYRENRAKGTLSVKELFSYPEISYQPNPVTKSDNVTLTCDTTLSPHRADMELQFAFYRNWHNVQEFGLSNQYQLWTIQLEDTGYFNCEVKTATDSVRKKSIRRRIQIQELSFPQIKVNSQEVTEGAEMTLTCDTISQYLTNLLTGFYRDGEMVQGFNLSNKYQVQSTQLEDSGNYTCEVSTSNYNVKKRSRVFHIQIQGSISFWVIVPLGQPVELLLNVYVSRSGMSLTCDTISRYPKDLLFAFYRDGEMVQGFSLSNTYQVQSTQLEDSGNYTCEVRTSNYNVKKRSRILSHQLHTGEHSEDGAFCIHISYKFGFRHLYHEEQLNHSTWRAQEKIIHDTSMA